MNRKETIYFAILRGQEEVKFGGETITLPEPQKSGTITQQKAYAKWKASTL